MTDNTTFFEIVKGMLKSIFQLNMQTFKNNSDIVSFCSQYRLSNIQSWLQPEALELILDKSHRESINYFEDSLHLRIILFYYDNVPVIIGPYLAEEISVKQSIQLTDYYQLSMTPQELKIYYGSFPILPDLQIDRITNYILKEFHLTRLAEHYHFFKSTDLMAEPIEPGDGKDLSNANLELHYDMEQKYMNAIKEGDFHTAISYKDILSNHSNRLWQKNHSKDSALNGYAVNRAMTRIAAYEAGVPAPVVHQISFRESIALMNANTISQMEKINHKMIQEFCDYIAMQKKHQYSALVQSILYTMTQNYNTPLTVQQLAKDFHISESYMITVFKKETGVTPAEYLRNIRLENAASLLISSHEKIQEVSCKVGIYDSNYFVKLFKAKYDLTPREYRKKYQI
ncbi:MAG: helix-turn-helix transcriptional regulator [Lachnospiraceae bacterium]|nr:helix-turn-helix transcriptional regulator [Lachnospiraceae bacterium]